MSTVKYHVSPTSGKPEKCGANKKPCPLGGEHFATAAEANVAIEKQAAAEAGGNEFGSLQQPAATTQYPTFTKEDSWVESDRIGHTVSLTHDWERGEEYEEFSGTITGEVGFSNDVFNTMSDDDKDELYDRLNSDMDLEYGSEVTIDFNGKELTINASLENEHSQDEAFAENLEYEARQVLNNFFQEKREQQEAKEKFERLAHDDVPAYSQEEATYYPIDESGGDMHSTVEEMGYNISDWNYAQTDPRTTGYHTEEYSVEFGPQDTPAAHTIKFSDNGLTGEFSAEHMDVEEFKYITSVFCNKSYSENGDLGATKMELVRDGKTVASLQGNKIVDGEGNAIGKVKFLDN